MSIESMAVVLHHAKSRGTAKLVLLGIANHEGDGGAWPTHTTLARYANVDESNVRKAIRQLVHRGEVEVQVQEGGTRDCPDQLRPNRYVVLVKCPGWCDRTTNHRDTRNPRGPQPGLWITRGADAPSPPPSYPDRGAEAPPAPGAAAPPKPSTQPGHPADAASTTDRARPAPQLGWRPCSVCAARDQSECERRQVKLLPEDQHPYTEARP